jgi:hypothetical protein
MRRATHFRLLPRSADVGVYREFGWLNVLMPLGFYLVAVLLLGKRSAEPTFIVVGGGAIVGALAI